MSETAAAQILTALESDADELASVAAVTFPLACPPELTIADINQFVADNLTADHFRAFIADPTHHVFKAVDPETSSIAGYALVIDEEPTDPDVLAAITTRPLTMVSKMYVLPGHHGRHASTELMSAALGHAAAAGSELVWLGVNQKNLRAQRFYRKMGFEVVGHKTFQVNGAICNDFIFARTPTGEAT
ncbi:GNAT family N-acetyltransferase [Williamsia sp.]|uniref:GNAT family N-acetyltransferase n=1 Tax=Williamsia sp. TaxID=1872085 RepID=UPI002F91D747